MKNFSKTYFHLYLISCLLFSCNNSNPDIIEDEYIDTNDYRYCIIKEKDIHEDSSLESKVIGKLVYNERVVILDNYFDKETYDRFYKIKTVNNLIGWIETNSLIDHIQKKALESLFNNFQDIKEYLILGRIKNQTTSSCLGKKNYTYPASEGESIPIGKEIFLIEPTVSLDKEIISWIGMDNEKYYCINSNDIEKSENIIYLKGDKLQSFEDDVLIEDRKLFILYPSKKAIKFTNGTSYGLGSFFPYDIYDYNIDISKISFYNGNILFSGFEPYMRDVLKYKEKTLYFLDSNPFQFDLNDFEINFLEAWKQKNNYKIWYDYNNDRIDIVYLFPELIF